MTMEEADGNNLVAMKDWQEVTEGVNWFERKAKLKLTSTVQQLTLDVNQQKQTLDGMKN